MKKWFADGNDLSDAIKDKLESKGGELFENLASKLGMSVEDLAKYEMLKEVSLKTTNGYMRADVVLLFRNKKEGIELPSSDAPNGYTWHHMDDFDPATGDCTMQLVKKNVHTTVEGMAHSGSVLQYKNYYINASKAPNNLFYTK